MARSKVLRSKALVWFLSLLYFTPLWAAPTVVTTIKPLDDLVAAVMAGVGTPVRLLPAGASPHTYALKPSDRQRMGEADLLIWVGPEVESALQPAVEALPPRVRVVRVRDLPGVTLLPAREGGAWEAHSHGRHDPPNHHDPRHHAHEVMPSHDQGIDGHLWLSPANAIAILRYLAAVLGEHDPSNRVRYVQNSAEAETRLLTLDKTLRAHLAPVADRPFIVFHDAYQYFEVAYRLRAVGSVTIRPEVPLGAKRVAQLRERITRLGAVCVFTEPHFEPRLVKTLTEGTAARAGVLDPLGVDLPSGLAGYEQLLLQLADQFRFCLEGRQG